MKSNGSQSRINDNQEVIKKILFDRNHMIHQLKKNISKRQNSLPMEDATKIRNHCSQYAKLNNVVHSILRQGRGSRKNQNLDHEQFWKENQRMERKLEEQIRKLKQIDQLIDNIVNEEFDKCNEIDEVEETIRIILSKKGQHHIEKAQPYFLQKQKCLDFLKIKKKQKQTIKQHKLSLVQQILSLLQTLREHREAGLMHCLSKAQDKNQLVILNRAISDIHEMNKNKQEAQLLKQQEVRLMSYLNQIQSKMQNITKQLLKLMTDQTTVCQQLEQINKLKTQTQYFERTLLNTLGLNEDENLTYIAECLQKYEIEVSQKEKQAIKIQQGIQTTNNTINIFQHIFDKVQSENRRRKELLRNIQQIKHNYSLQDKAKDQITQIEAEVERMQIKKNKLTKTMETKITQADVKTYKNIYGQLEQIERETFKKHKNIEVMKNSINQNLKKLYRQIIELQEEFGDILSQTVPNLWVHEQEFNNEQSLKDLNICLTKTFKRLSVTD